MTPHQRPGPSHHHTQQSIYVPSMMLVNCNQARYMTLTVYFTKARLGMRSDAVAAVAVGRCGQAFKRLRYVQGPSASLAKVQN